jgi:hypothetical protein
MKLTVLTITALLIIAGDVVCATAANLDGHMKYTIVSYSFNIDGTETLIDDNSQELLITHSQRDLLNDSMKNSKDFGIADSKPTTDILAMSAEFSATPELSLHGALGISKNKQDFTFDPEYNASWEANVGVIYKLFNNIRYEVHFGYMETGDLFKEKNSYTDVESIIMISNQLSMSF